MKPIKNKRKEPQNLSFGISGVNFALFIQLLATNVVTNPVIKVISIPNINIPLTFLASKNISILTGIADLDFIILNKLDDITLVKLCQVNSSVNNFCKDDKLWKMRVEQQFPGAEKFRESQSPKEWYKLIINIMKERKHSNSHLIKEYIPANIAAKYGHDDILEWMKEIKLKFHVRLYTNMQNLLSFI